MGQLSAQNPFPRRIKLLVDAQCAKAAQIGCAPHIHLNKYINSMKEVGYCGVLLYFVRLLDWIRFKIASKLLQREQRGHSHEMCFGATSYQEI